MSNLADASSRSEMQDNLVTFLSENPAWSAPYGILHSKRTDKNGRSYRSVTFGRARTLDAEAKIYGSSFIVLRWQGSINSRASSQQVFKSLQELFDFLNGKDVTS